MSRGPGTDVTLHSSTRRHGDAHQAVDCTLQRMDSERARELLARERRRILQGLGALGPQESDEPTTTDAHMADQASDLYDNELDAGLSDDLRVELAAVERAEQRLAAGRYGLSIESGEPIPDERLEAVPTAERTAEEQARFERGG
jgi:DnaK suppressor protein